MSLPPLSPDQMVKPRRFELRISLLFAAMFVPVGIHLPYFPLWLQFLGLRAEEIAIVLSAPMFLRVVTTPFITAFADRSSDRAKVLAAVVAATLLLSLGYLVTTGFATVLAVSLLIAIVWTPHSPLADSLALSGVRRFGSDYSRMRVWGSVAFLLANLGGGFILAAMGAGAVPVIISTALAVLLAVTLFAPRLGPPRRPSPLSAAQLQDTPPSLMQRSFLLFVAGAGLVNASHGFLFGFGSIYWSALGITETTVGALWAWAVVAEVGMFAAFTRVFGRSPPSRLIMMAAIAAMVRWTAMPLIAGAGVGAFFAVQALHAVSTGLILLGVQKMIAVAVPDHQTGSAQGIAFFANGLTMATVTLASGPLYSALGADGFYVMALVAAAGLGLLVLAERQPQSAGSGGETRDPR